MLIRAQTRHRYSGAENPRQSIKPSAPIQYSKHADASTRGGRFATTAGVSGQFYHYRKLNNCLSQMFFF